MNGFWPALAVTLAVETTVAAGYLAALGLPWRLLAFVPPASLLTLPFVWFAFPLLPLPDVWVIASAEAFAVVVEAIFLFLAPAWRAWPGSAAVGGAAASRLTPAQALALSLIMNAASFALGLVL